MALIKNNLIVDDNWVLVSDKTLENSDQLPQGNLILPFKVWQVLSGQLGDRTLAVWLDSDESPEALKDALDQLSLIAVNFPNFADGRGYSYATVLRQQYGYKGELRAIGDVLRDQLFFLKRVGFDSFVLRADQNVDECVKALQDFSVRYQSSTDNPAPLFRTRRPQ